MASPKWSQYEESVYQTFKHHYPKADVKKDVRLKGRFSKRSRQIDVFVVEHTPAGDIPFAVDAKLYKRKVDVKVVESFEGFLNDLGLRRGILITNTGYTDAALKRAHYSPRGLELDILNFSELGKFQGFCAIPYFGKDAFVLAAPFGWVIDGTRTGPLICKLFQRGATFDVAMNQKEVIYVQSWDRKKDPLTADQLNRRQVEGMRKKGLSLGRILRLPSVARPEATIPLRLVEVKQYNALEVVGFLEFADVIFFAVLLTPKVKLKQNIRRLRHVLESVVHARMRRDNSVLIRSLEEKLAQTHAVAERARLLHEIGHWYRDMDELQRAKEYLDASLAAQVDYLAVKERLNLAAQLGEGQPISDLLDKLISLEPTNPTVYNDASDFAAREGHQPVLRKLLLARASREGEQPVAKASCWLYAAQLAPNRALIQSELAQAKGLFREALEPEHDVFKTIGTFERSLRNDPRKRR